jgi:hypothetical protein
VHNSRLSQIARKPVSAGAIVLTLVSVTTQMVALAAATGWSTTPRTDVQSTMAAAVIHSLQCGGSAATKPSACPSVPAQQPQAKLAGENSSERVLVPSGAAQCPNSWPGSSCDAHSVPIDTGSFAVPDGLPTCPMNPAKSVNALGSCTATAVTPPAPPAPAAAKTTVPGGASPAGGALHSPDPSTTADDTLTLTSSSSALNAGNAIRLDAKSTLNVSGTPYAIEIFDVTTKLLVGACTETAECQVSFSAKTGTHSFVAYVATPTQGIPQDGIKLSSNKVDVRFLGVTLAVIEPSIVAPGKAVTFVATATEDVAPTGFVIELHDAATGTRLTYCSRGTECSTSLVEPSGGVKTVIATLSPADPTVVEANPDVHAASTKVSATWLAVQGSAAVHSNVLSLSAIANADLSQTPYSIYFFDEAGKQVGSACNAASCAASAPAPRGKAAYVAVIGRLHAVKSGGGPLATVIGRVPTTIDRLDVQAASAPIKPSSMLWGVDSCKPLTDDPSGNSGLLPQVTGALGAPDFWGRYLPNTGNCGGLNSAEIAAAHSHHLGILPIYNDYDCSAVSGNATGADYAHAAIGWLWNDLIPQGTVIAIDIEPYGDQCPGAANVDTAFIQGWYDVLIKAGYVPAYYGDTAPGSAFANAWCATTQQRPDIAENSYLWSFEPSLTAPYGRGNMPAFNPYSTGCPGHYAAWQFQLSPGQDQDVDQDEASSELPLWYP